MLEVCGALAPSRSNVKPMPNKSRVEHPSESQAWFVSLREKNRALMGENFWPYGVEANRKTLEACLRHHREQGILKRSYNIEELFAPEALT